MDAHAEFLRRVTLEEAFVAELRHDYRKAAITPAERAMLDFVVQVTSDATGVNRGDVEGLRKNGFDDTAILQITLIASWFNYINRVADALGVGRDGADGSTLSTPAPAKWAPKD